MMFLYTLDVMVFYFILVYSFISFYFSFILFYYTLMLWCNYFYTLMFWVTNLRSCGVINLLSLLADGMANYCSFFVLE